MKERRPGESWQRDLYILWVCCFVLQLGFSLIMPFLSLYLEDLGVQGPAVDMWSGIIFSANFLMMAIFSPIWGGLSDRTGRKPMMLRSAFGMGLVVWLMGLVHSPSQLLVTRLLQGTMAGFMPASTAYMAGIAPRDKVGQALGLLSTGSIAGTVLGPLVGGVLADVMGYRPIFYLTSLGCFIAGLGVWLTIKEEFTPIARKKSDGLMSDLAMARRYPVVIAMLVVLFMNMFSMMTAEPILARYLQTLNAPAAWISFLSGVVFSMTGVANMVVAPISGRITDRVGSKQLLVICLAGASVLYIVQGLATATWHMIILRFVLGVFTGGLMPAVNGLIARTVSKDAQGRIFGLTNSAICIGMTVGPLVGGFVAESFGLRSVFPVTGILLMADLAWVFFGVKEPARESQVA